MVKSNILLVVCFLVVVFLQSLGYDKTGWTALSRFCMLTVVKFPVRVEEMEEGKERPHV
jgi:hypothetical protein